MYAYHGPNTKYVGMPLGTMNINVYLQDAVFYYVQNLPTSGTTMVWKPHKNT